MNRSMMQMRGTLLAVPLALAGMALSPLPAAADETTHFSGNVGVIVPKSAGIAPFNLTVGDKTVSNADVDNTLGGTLTVVFSGSATQPTLDPGTYS